MSTSQSGLRVLRKLGTAELVYDLEIKHGGCVLPFTLIFSCDLDLFGLKERVDRAIQLWKQRHTFLLSRIVILDDECENDEKYYSHERYFALMEQDRLSSLANVSYLRLEDEHASGESLVSSEREKRRLWEFLHERELNIKPVNSRDGPLWRLSVVELERGKDYALVFTSHHAIIDGRNAYCILEELLTLVDQGLTADDKESSVTFDVDNLPPVLDSIEKKLFNDDPNLLNDIHTNPEYDLTPDCKVPDLFAATQDEDKQVNNTSGIRFVYLFDKAHLKPIELVPSLEYSRVTQFTSLTFEPEKLKRLAEKCKRADAKLTGCLHVICSLATYDLYMSHLAPREYFTKIWYHYLINLRSLAHIDNLNMGYWPVVQNGYLNTVNKQLDIDEPDWYRVANQQQADSFWSLVKQESDTIHKRLVDMEHVETAKTDGILLDMIERGVKFEQGGGVHYALSNLGSFPDPNLTHIGIKEIYYNVSCAPNRWSTGIFHGLSTLNDRLCWSIGWNCQLISPRYVRYLCESIQRIISLVITRQD